MSHGRSAGITAGVTMALRPTIARLSPQARAEVNVA